MRIELQKDLLYRFYRLTHIFTIAVSFLPLGILFNILFIVEEASLTAVWTVNGIIGGLWLIITLFLLWHSRQYTNALEYQVEDNILFIKEGVFTYQHKSIPLDRVTDIRMVQTLFMRWIGIWRIHVQTAGVGTVGPEGLLWAIESPKAVRQQLLALRQMAVTAEKIEPAT